MADTSDPAGSQRRETDAQRRGSGSLDGATIVNQPRLVAAADASSTNDGSLYANSHQNSNPEVPNDASPWPQPNATTGPSLRSQISHISASGRQKQSPGPSASLSRHDTQDQSPIDPLSQHILKRTNTERSFSSKARPRLSFETEPLASESHLPPLSEDGPSTNRPEAGTAQAPAKDKKKGVSFLSRIIGGKKKGTVSEENDDVSELGEPRTTGLDSELFAHPIGYIPRYPPPPKYIKVRAKHTKTRAFDRLFLAQDLKGSPAEAELDSAEFEASAKGNKAVWAAEFSKNGKYLAVAGQDKRVRVWAIISKAEDRHAHETEEEARNGQTAVRLSAPVFKTHPIRLYEGHTASIVDLSWSKNDFLLTTSMDKTVRLWHVTRDECLCCFKHGDFVTSIEFHPRDDRFFLAGSLDCKLRLWSIPDKAIAYSVTIPDMITAVAFTPDGKYSLAGCLNGLCTIYETDGLKPLSQLHVRSARGKNAKGSKVTGIDTIVQPPTNENGSVKLLITSNDSRIRLYNFKDRTLEAKFRGNENASSQIRASFSSDGKYAICGSEDGRVYIWPLDSTEKYPDKRPIEFFDAHNSIVTTAIMAPTVSKMLLGSTGDLLYDLCNPPPVTLVSATASVISKDQARNDEEPVPPQTPQSLQPPSQQKAEESPAYVARSAHPGGNIIVTADYLGKIKIFRQDCGYHKRRHELWETNSTFSRKLLGRTNSVSTRHSVASSIGRESKTPSERILSWRNSVIGGPDNRSADNLRGTPEPAGRSGSPSKPRKDSPFVDTNKPATPNSTSSQRFGGTIFVHHNNQPTPPPRFLSTVNSEESTPFGPNDETPRPFGHNSNKEDPSYISWNKAQAETQHDSAQDAYGGKSALASNGATGDDNVEYEEELGCSRCQGTHFRATRLKNGEQRLICTQCGCAAL
ncbi:WD domain G-beta repeat [Trichophyton interdigitale]|uniref:WD repeat protein, variant n=1 Tax=Trichophyton interdigitale TaxID=101480 RepID=A0A9P4YNG5_9EURO|nr:WD repeat protein, variant [Trichophyton interdigitale]KAF3899803.1 WD repeat protein, variant [Trichophyton interdigitale]KAG8207723.1 WD domain G-beta repeat [Trichophyton interdigitale]